MSSLIPGFRPLLCSGASLGSGAFSFLCRQIIQFACVAAFGLGSLPAFAAGAGTQHSIAFDHYSLMIDGKRVFIYSGEFHPFRLPSPDLWLDVFQKMKAGGFNTICCYFDWDYHSSKSGTYDFTGIRDLDRFLSLASEAGLYVIVRPGPYINAEVDSGGFPGWLTTIQGRARSTASDYLAAAYEWLSQIDPIIARHQLMSGTGTVIACQVENEFYDSSPIGQQYMQDLENKMRADGIRVPLTGNHNATFMTGLGATDIAGFDIYPQGFDASNPTQWKPVPEWLESGHNGLPPNEPLYLPEFQGGSMDSWGGAGYLNCYIMTRPDFENIFYKSLIAQGATMISYYMTYGGTSWGWLPFPGVYSSYDYGSAINEARQFTGKYGEQKLIALFTQAVGSLAKTIPTSPSPPTDSNLTLTERFNPDDETEIYLLAHRDTTSSTVEQTHIAVDLSPRTGHTRDDRSSASNGAFVAVDATDLPPGNATNFYPSVPQQTGTAITVNGRDAKLLLANYQFGAQRLVYSTSQLMTNGSDKNADFAVLYDNQGNEGETVLRYSSQPKVQVLQGTVTTTWDSNRGDLRLNYVHSGLARVLIQSSSGSLLLLLADTTTAEQLWPLQVQGRPVLVSGPYLIRSAWAIADVLFLTGDTDGPTQVSVLFPQSIKQTVWLGSLSGPPQVKLPNLANWTFQFESPERNPAFDDSNWTVANHTTTNNPNRPGSLPVLYEDDYGFHHGDVWYRGHFVATGNETGITLDGAGGGNGLYSVWLNGALLGTQASGSNNFTFPAGVLQPGQDNVISVLVMNMGHDEDFSPNDSYKSPRGIRTAILLGAKTAIQWKIQGSIGGENLVDPVRGPMNIGGLYGERHGWFLPGYPDQNWRKVSLPDRWSNAGLPPGIGWYRTEFNPQLPVGTDVPLGVQINDDPSRHYRALIFLNGWMLGIYVNDLGPQHIFSLPNGILNPDGPNTLAIAVWGEDADAGLGSVRLYQYGAYAGGIPVSSVTSPGWNGTWGTPGLSNNLVINLSSNPPVTTGGQTAKIAGTVTNAGSAAAQSVKVSLNVPSGWTVSQSSPILIPAIPPGISVSVSWSVQIPSGLTPGRYQLAAIASYIESGTANHTAGTVALQVPYPNLAAAFDNAGVTSNSNKNPAPGFLGFDGIGTTNYANCPTGSSGHTVYVFGVTVPIDSTKKVQAVVLPKVDGSVAGYQAAMHIFAMGL
jgi:beta-galactosidase GanA